MFQKKKFSNENIKGILKKVLRSTVHVFVFLVECYNLCISGTGTSRASTARCRWSTSRGAGRAAPAPTTVTRRPSTVCTALASLALPTHTYSATTLICQLCLNVTSQIVCWLSQHPYSCQKRPHFVTYIQFFFFIKIVMGDIISIKKCLNILAHVTFAATEYSIISSDFFYVPNENCRTVHATTYPAV